MTITDRRTVLPLFELAFERQLPICQKPLCFSRLSGSQEKTAGFRILGFPASAS